MAILEIIKNEHHLVLKKKCRRVENISNNMKKLINNMIETMYHSGGIGLAANQINKDWEIIIIHHRLNILPRKKETDPMVLINPRIIKHSDTMTSDWEGCLSLPGQNMIIDRYDMIEIAAMQIDGSFLKFEAKDLLSRCLQHEIDHLNGILITDRFNIWRQNIGV